MPEITDKIRDIMTRHIFPNRGTENYHAGPDTRIAAAAETIAALPVDRVEAMIALIREPFDYYFDVPGDDAIYRVFIRSASRTGGMHCFKLMGERPDCQDASRDGTCDHIKAVKLYLERRAKGQE